MLQRLLLALSSAVLLIVSFPNFNQPWCAWVALVPWLLALRDMSLHEAFWWSWVIGLVFFFGSIWWLIHVTALGLILLCATLALFFALFGWFVVLIHPPPSPLHRLLVISSAWVSLEYLRSHVLSGCGWNLLGYSQTPSLSAIQMADVTGVWGVSFALVVMNVAITQFVAERDARKALPAVMLAVGCLLASWLYGQYRLKQPEPGPRVTIAVVQGNISQAEKWDEAKRESILNRYERLTQAAAAHEPHLVIWPETSVPGYLGLDEALTDRVSRLAQSVKTPLVVGAPMGRLKGNLVQLTNSAVLLDPSGAMRDRYDKLHLVPFGEFVPFEKPFPWLRGILPSIGNFVPGHDYTVFRLDSASDLAGRGAWGVGQGNSHQPSPLVSRPLPPFSVLICFEDIFPELARQFVQRGARLLVTITNDAWFGKTAAAYQHAQASTFRAVELRVPMVRAANTGWSGCIDSKGRWLSSVHNLDGEELFVEGVAICEMALGESNPASGLAGSLYRRWGDWFAGLCLVVSFGWLCVQVLVRHRVGAT